MGEIIRYPFSAFSAEKAERERERGLKESLQVAVEESKAPGPYFHHGDGEESRASGPHCHHGDGAESRASGPHCRHGDGAES